MGLSMDYLLKSLKARFDDGGRPGSQAGRLDIFQSAAGAKHQCGSITIKFAVIAGFIHAGKGSCSRWLHKDAAFTQSCYSLQNFFIGHFDEVTSCLPVSYTHLRAHETRHDLVCRLLL